MTPNKKRKDRTKESPKKKGPTKVSPKRRKLQTSSDLNSTNLTIDESRHTPTSTKADTSTSTSIVTRSSRGKIGESRHTPTSTKADTSTSTSIVTRSSRRIESRHTSKSKKADVVAKVNIDSKIPDNDLARHNPNMVNSDSSYQEESNAGDSVDAVLDQHEELEQDISLSNNSPDNEDNHEADNNKKFTKIFSEDDVLLPRASNKKPPSNYSYTVHNLNYMKDKVGRKEANDYYSLQSEEKKGFIIKLVETIIVGKTFYKYNEILEKYIVVEESHINSLVTDRLKNLNSDSRFKAKRYSKPILTTNKGSNFNTVEYVAKNSYMAFEKIYPNVKVAKKTHNWNMFSMFHSLYQSFSIYLYNYSHKLEDNEKVHRCTKTKLTFPEFANCILLIHGRLVHSGAESKEEGPLSFNWSHDVRMFAYLSTFTKDEKKREIYTNFSENNKVVRDTFTVCGKNCVHCKTINNTMCVNHDHFKEVDVGEHIKQYSKNRKAITVMSSHKQRAPTKILGDMKKLGWEVHTGVQFSLDKYQNLNAQIRGCVRGDGSAEWQGIGGTSRCAFKVDHLLSDPTKKKIIDKMPLITTAYDDVHNIVLKKIPYLGRCVQMEGRSLLANMDQVDEQKPHRDFKEIKK